MRLETLVADGLAELGGDDVRAALEAELARFAGTPTPEVIAVEAPVLGVDACRTGWVGVLLSPRKPAAVLASTTIRALVELARETTELAVVAIDIPIGLPDNGRRLADELVRRALPGKGSSVFATLTRAAYTAESYALAREQNLAATGGLHSASAQAYALRQRILDVDGWLRSRPGIEVVEVHPELCFARMAGAPIAVRKKDPEGSRARRVALEAAGIVPPPWFRGSGFDEDDLLDACAAAWTAHRRALGQAECIPPQPEVFSDGLSAAIWV